MGRLIGVRLLRYEKAHGGWGQPCDVGNRLPGTPHAARGSRDDFITSQRLFTEDEWIDFLIQSVGFDPTRFDRRAKMLML